MIINMSYWTRVLKNLLYVIFILIGLYVALKLSIFYMPFLVAFVISLMIEPVIKKIMKKTGLTRRTSSIIIFILVSIIIIGGLTWLLITLFAESSNLLQSLNDYIDKLYSQFQNLINYFNFDNIHLSSEILNISSDELFNLELLDIFDGGFNLVSNLIKSDDSAVVRSKIYPESEIFLEIRASEYEDEEDEDEEVDLEKLRSSLLRIKEVS